MIRKDKKLHSIRKSWSKSKKQLLSIIESSKSTTTGKKDGTAISSSGDVVKIAEDQNRINLAKTTITTTTSSSCRDITASSKSEEGDEVDDASGDGDAVAATVVPIPILRVQTIDSHHHRSSSSSMRRYRSSASMRSSSSRRNHTTSRYRSSGSGTVASYTRSTRSTASGRTTLATSATVMSTTHQYEDELKNHVHQMLFTSPTNYLMGLLGEPTEEEEDAEGYIDNDGGNADDDYDVLEEYQKLLKKNSNTNTTAKSMSSSPKTKKNNMHNKKDDEKKATRMDQDTFIGTTIETKKKTGVKKPKKEKKQQTLNDEDYTDDEYATDDQFADNYLFSDDGSCFNDSSSGNNSYDTTDPLPSVFSNMNLSTVPSMFLNGIVGSFDNLLDIDGNKKCDKNNRNPRDSNHNDHDYETNDDDDSVSSYEKSCSDDVSVDSIIAIPRSKRNKFFMKRKKKQTRNQSGRDAAPSPLPGATMIVRAPSFNSPTFQRQPLAKPLMIVRAPSFNPPTVKQRPAEPSKKLTTQQPSQNLNRNKIAMRRCVPRNRSMSGEHESFPSHKLFPIHSDGKSRNGDDTVATESRDVDNDNNANLYHSSTRLASF